MSLGMAAGKIASTDLFDDRSIPSYPIAGIISPFRAVCG